jgi:hypothetical protein
MNNFWDKLLTHTFSLMLPLLVMLAARFCFMFAVWEYYPLSWGFLRVGLILGVFFELAFLCHILGGKSKDE